MSAFIAARDLRIDGVHGADGSVTLHTRGLTARGLPELAIANVAIEDSKLAAAVINRVAEYVANTKPIHDGERVAIVAKSAALIASLRAAPEHGEYLEIIEPLDDMAPLQTLLATMRLWRAEAAIDENDLEAAYDWLVTAIEAFPGDPARREGPTIALPFNWENHLAYARLASLVEGDEAVELLAQALERCATFELAQLGDPSELLRSVQPFGSVSRVVEMIESNRASMRRDVGTGVVATASPIWRRGEDGMARRRLAIVPEDHAYTGEALLADRRWLGLAADLAYEYTASPARLLCLTRDTVGFWEDGTTDAPETVTGMPYETGDQLLSFAVAHVARLVAASCTFAEAAAVCGLDSDGNASASGVTKLERLTEVEHAALHEALAPAGAQLN